MNSTPLLSVRDLRVNFRMDKHTNFEALKGVSFDIPREQTVALVGESGSGKSVSSLAIMGLLPKENATVDPRSQVLYGGRDLLRLSGDEMRQLRGKEISMIFQDPMSSLNPVLSIGNQLNEILMLHMGLSARQAQERSIALLEEVGLPEPSRRINRYPF